MNAGAAPASDRLVLALLIAAAVHVLLIFGVSFRAFTRAPQQQAVEVTLVLRPSERPDYARHLAAANQQGESMQALRELGATSAQQAGGAARRGERAPEYEDPQSLQRLSARQAATRVPDAQLTREQDRKLSAAEQELARLQQQLERLQANLDPSAQTRSTSRDSRTRRINSVAALAAVDAAYLAQWRQRVEAVGNQYYPEASRRYGIYGSLEMLVTVRSDGNLDDIRILRSSGHAVLDEAALRIVRAAAPYGPFPPALRESTDRLEIVRTWQFEQNPLSSTQGR